ncbi:MAG: YihY/virulence factor BrkB family protein, partial [Myxococcota bacterium]
MRGLGRLFKASFLLFGEARGSLLSAAISFYAIFSLAPMAVVAVGVGSLLLEDETVRGQFERMLEQEVGSEPAGLVSEMMEEQESGRSGSLLASAGGLLVLLYASTRLFMQLQRALNQSWGISPPAS